ncbi:hypothetical protein [Paraferrimonas sp. SM1919]|uniref:hypothetical protein n=1 Tax=Paraferrimonas sp. SM1919 TaxID=2662263 RepID=UPI0013D5E3A5|nr:hypothetical protein [Paraferrimonas sp. SM1919]
MEFIQKKGSFKHTFQLKDNYFNFAYADKSGSGDIDHNYADFPQKHSVQIEQNDWLRNVGYLWIVIGIIQFGLAYSEGLSLVGKGFWFYIGLGCVAWSAFTKVKFSVFSNERGNIFIIQDSQHDNIINELNKRRKTQLLQWYGEVNLENELQQEINKFNWLADQNILSRNEADTKIAQAELMFKSEDSVVPERLN